MCSPSSPSFALAGQHQGRKRGMPDTAGTLSPDGMYTAVPGSNHTVEVWDNRFSCRLLTYIGHQDGLYRRTSGRILAITWSPDGTRIASASNNGSLHLWDAHSGIHQRTLLPASTDAMQMPPQEQECELIWSPDGLHFHRQREQEQEQKVWNL